MIKVVDYWRSLCLSDLPTHLFMWALGVNVTFGGWTFIFVTTRPNWQYSGNDWRPVSIIKATWHLANKGWSKVQHNAVPNNNNVFITDTFIQSNLKARGDSNLQPLDHALPLSYTYPSAVYVAWTSLHKMYLWNNYRLYLLVPRTSDTM